MEDQREVVFFLALQVRLKPKRNVSRQAQQPSPMQINSTANGLILFQQTALKEKQRCSEEGGRVLVESAQLNLRTAKLQHPVFHAVAQGIPAPETLACPPEFGQKDKVIRQI